MHVYLIASLGLLIPDNQAGMAQDARSNSVMPQKKLKNPLTNLWRKRTRRSSTCKRRITFATTPLERLCSKIFLERASHFAGCATYYVFLTFRMMFFRNIQLARNTLFQYQLSMHVAASLILIESLIVDAHANYQACRLFAVPIANLRIDNFQNDEHCENWTLFKKCELLDLINMLGLDEWTRLQHATDHFCRFNREVIFICTFAKLACGLPHAIMSDMIADRNSCR